MSEQPRSGDDTSQTDSNDGASPDVAVRPASGGVTRYALAGGLAGLVGAVVQSAWLALATGVMGSPPWMFWQALSLVVMRRGELSRYDPVAVSAGVVLHLTAALGVGVMYGAGIGRQWVGEDASVFLGMAYGMTVWLLAEYVALPAVQASVLQVIDPFVLAVSLLAYGLFLGYLYPIWRKRPMGH